MTSPNDGRGSRSRSVERTRPEISLDASGDEGVLRSRCALSSNEGAIRAALKNKCRRQHHGRDDVLVIDELGLAHARSRIDLAVFNGSLHGYEIKSANDTLYRLPMQLDIYSSALQKLTLVVATRHVSATFALIPEWCGLIEIVNGPRGGIKFETRRRSSLNPKLDHFVFAHLLWRSEAQELLKLRGVATSDLNAPRKALYRKLVDEFPVRDLACAIKSFMASRTRWRDH